MECGNKSPLAKAVPRHRTPKKWSFQGQVSAPEIIWGMGSPPTAARHDMKASASTSNCVSPIQFEDANRSWYNTAAFKPP